MIEEKLTEFLEALDLALEVNRPKTWQPGYVASAAERTTAWRRCHDLRQELVDVARRAGTYEQSFKAVMVKMEESFNYIQNNPDEFGAMIGDDKFKIVNDAFMKNSAGPTGWAYEQVCKARDKWQAEAEAVEPTIQQISDYLAGLDSIKRSIVEREARAAAEAPVGYAIHTIGGRGDLVISDVKLWAGKDSLCDDGGLGEYWMGNVPLVYAAQPVESGKEQA